MNRKQRRAAARMKKIDLGSAPANSGWHKDIALAKSLYFSAHPGAGGAPRPDAAMKRIPARAGPRDPMQP